MAGKEKTGENENKKGNHLFTALVVLLIIIIWLAIFILLIKLDFMGFGSGVLTPILKDVPVVNRILPDSSTGKNAQEENAGFSSLPEAVKRVKELEATVKELEAQKAKDSAAKKGLKDEADRLREFENNQKKLEKQQLEFDKNVVYADAAPGIEAYKKYYDEMNPTNAEKIYRQVVEQLAYSKAIVEKADIYKNMDPKAAAKVFETMSADVESVAKILLSMKPKESAPILDEMDPVFAAKVTKKMLDMDKERLAD
jgi:flagellar motility protein MotE (MotC chaperone)